MNNPHPLKPCYECKSVIERVNDIITFTSLPEAKNTDAQSAGLSEVVGYPRNCQTIHSFTQHRNMD